MIERVVVVVVGAIVDTIVGGLGVREVMQADARMRSQTSGTDGLWSIDTFWDEDGYFISLGYDSAATSFHVFTTDGIRGRDRLGR